MPIGCIMSSLTVMYSVCNVSPSICSNDVQSHSVAVSQFQPSASCIPTCSANLAFAPTSGGGHHWLIGVCSGAAASMHTSSVLALAQSSTPRLRVPQTAHDSIKPLHSPTVAADIMYSSSPATPRNAFKEHCIIKDQSNSCCLPETSLQSPEAFGIMCSVRSSLPPVLSLPAGVNSTAPSAECSSLNLLDRSVGQSTVVKNTYLHTSVTVADCKDKIVMAVTATDSLAATRSSSFPLGRTNLGDTANQTKDCFTSQNCNYIGSCMQLPYDEHSTISNAADRPFTQNFLIPEVQSSADNNQCDSDAPSNVACVPDDLCIAKSVSAVAADGLLSNFSSTHHLILSDRPVLLPSAPAYRNGRHYLDSLIPLKMSNELKESNNSNDRHVISAADSATLDIYNAETCNRMNQDFTNHLRCSHEFLSPVLHCEDACSDSNDLTSCQNTSVNSHSQNLTTSSDNCKVKDLEPVLSRVLFSHFNDSVAGLTGKVTSYHQNYRQCSQNTVAAVDRACHSSSSPHHWAANNSSARGKKSLLQGSQQPSFALAATSGKLIYRKKKIAFLHQKEDGNLCGKLVSKVCCKTSSPVVGDSTSEYCTSSQVAEYISVSEPIDDRVNGQKASAERQVFFYAFSHHIIIC